MKTGEVKLIQIKLAENNLYNGKTDGKRGPKTDKAIYSALTHRNQDLPRDWENWSRKRMFIAYSQLLCNDNSVDAGPIDGYFGPQTESAIFQLIKLNESGILPRGFGDILPISANPHAFPVELEAQLTNYYGKPCEIPLVEVPCPWTLRPDWDLNSITKTISIHEKLSDSLDKILQNAYNHYGMEGIRRHGLDRFGGSYKCRKKLGCLSAYSTHAWGIAIDWYPSQNKLKWDNNKASLADPDLDIWWEFWEREGWVSLGRSENRSWMHVQAAKRQS